MADTQLSPVPEEPSNKMARTLMGSDLANTTFTDDELGASRPGSVQLPVGAIAAGGSALIAALAGGNTAVTSGFTLMEGLYRPYLANGVAGTLTAAHDFGYLGMVRDSSRIVAQARWVEAADVPFASVTHIPVSPLDVAALVMLAEITAKLDDIKRGQQEILNYMRIKDDAAVLADLKALSELQQSYAFNWNNESYRLSAQTNAQRIRNQADAAIERQRGLVRSQLAGPALPIPRIGEAPKDQQVAEEFGRYRLALYEYAYAALVETAYVGNMGHGYLEHTIGAIEQRSNDYRTLYTKTYDALEAEARMNPGTAAMGAVGGFAKTLGGLVQKTPVGEATLIDEVLAGAGNHLEDASNKQVNDALRRLRTISDPGVASFAAALHGADRLMNGSTDLLVGHDGVYLVPREDESDAN
jgi:hypothetical protein